MCVCTCTYVYDKYDYTVGHLECGNTGHTGHSMKECRFLFFRGEKDNYVYLSGIFLLTSCVCLLAMKCRSLEKFMCVKWISNTHTHTLLFRLKKMNGSQYTKTVRYSPLRQGDSAQVTFSAVFVCLRLVCAPLKGKRGVKREGWGKIDKQNFCYI